MARAKETLWEGERRGSRALVVACQIRAVSASSVEMKFEVMVFVASAFSSASCEEAKLM